MQQYVLFQLLYIKQSGAFFQLFHTVKIVNVHCSILVLCCNELFCLLYFSFLFVTGGE